VRLLTLFHLEVCTNCHLVLRRVDLIWVESLPCSVVLRVVLHCRIVLHLSILLLPVMAALLVQVLISHCSSEVRILEILSLSLLVEAAGILRLSKTIFGTSVSGVLR